MSFRAPISLSLISFFFLAACSSTSSTQGATSTSTVTPKTVAGVCSKLNELSCAQPNCVDKFTLIQSNCKDQAADVQSLLDCLSVAAFTCGGSPNIPRTSECQANVDRLTLCADGATSSDPVSGADAGTAGTCTSASDCTAWPCGCADGTIVNVSSCTSQKCGDGITLCASDSAPLVAACKSHGGVN